MQSSSASKPSLAPYLQVAPLTLVLLMFFAVPVALVVVVSFFRYQMLVGIVPDFTFKNYIDRKSTRLNSSHANISYAVFCLKKKKQLYCYQYNYPFQVLLTTQWP